MADTEVSIANAALAKLGCGTIVSLDDASKHAQFCQRFYSSTRNEVMSSHRWNFAMKRAKLLDAPSTPPSEWSHAFLLPEDCLRVLQINGYEVTELKGEYSVEGGQLFADQPTANIRYLARIESVAMFPPLFIAALISMLASKLAVPLTGSQGIGAELMREYASFTGPMARMADVLEGNFKRKPAWSQSDLVRSRF